MATSCVSTSSAKKSSKKYSLDWDLEEIRRYKDEDCFTYNGNRIKWTDSFEMLRLFIECSIELPGTWSTPGGKYKKFTSSVSDLILTWNYDLFTLSFRGVERARLKEICVCTRANKMYAPGQIKISNLPVTLVRVTPKSHRSLILMLIIIRR